MPSNEFFTQDSLATRYSSLATNMKLSDLKKGEKATIMRIRDGELTKQLMTLGLDFSAPVEMKYKAPFGGPVCIKNNKKFIVIRSSEAQEIAIASL